MVFEIAWGKCCCGRCGGYETKLGKTARGLIKRHAVYRRKGECERVRQGSNGRRDHGVGAHTDHAGDAAREDDKWEAYHER